MSPLENRLAWLVERQTGIGASDAPNLVGVGYQNAAAVYRSKVTPPDGRLPRSGPLARGIALESAVADRYADELGVAILPARPLVRHPDRLWQFASPDRVRADGRHVELKTAAGFSDEWGESGGDRIPDGYAVQVQHQMGVLGEPVIDLGALCVITWEFRFYRVAFDPGFFDWLTAIEARFLAEHVAPRIPPAAEWEQQFRGGVLPQKGTRTDLGDVGAELVARRKELSAISAEADAECKRLGARLESLMGDAESATAGPWILKRVTVAGAEVSYTRAPFTRLDIRAAKRKETL